MLPQVRQATIERAIAALEAPPTFGTEQAEANRLIARIHPVICDRCDADGHLAGVRKRRKCRRCDGKKYGYKFGTACFWTGWARVTREAR